MKVSNTKANISQRRIIDNSKESNQLEGEIEGEINGSNILNTTELGNNSNSFQKAPKYNLRGKSLTPRTSKLTRIFTRNKQEKNPLQSLTHREAIASLNSNATRRVDLIQHRRPIVGK